MSFIFHSHTQDSFIKRYDQVLGFARDMEKKFRKSSFQEYYLLVILVSQVCHFDRFSRWPLGGRMYLLSSQGNECQWYSGWGSHRKWVGEVMRNGALPTLSEIKHTSHTHVSISSTQGAWPAAMWAWRMDVAALGTKKDSPLGMDTLDNEPREEQKNRQKALNRKQWKWQMSYYNLEYLLTSTPWGFHEII